MPLCTQEDVEKIGQVDFTANPDAAVEAWIAAATQAVESYCGRQFEETASATETIDGPAASSIIRLAGYPVTAVGALTENGTALTDGDEFVWYPDGRVVRTVSGIYDRAWMSRRQTIAVTYDYGWAVADVPDDLRTVAAHIVLRLFNAGQVFANAPAGTVGPAESITLEGIGSVSYGTSNSGVDVGGSGVIGEVPLLTRMDRDILDRYKRRI